MLVGINLVQNITFSFTKKENKNNKVFMKILSCSLRKQRRISENDISISLANSNLINQRRLQFTIIIRTCRRVHGLEYI